MDKGVRFDTDEGQLSVLGMEGAHRQKRIVHCGGDATGKFVMDHLIASLRIGYRHYWKTVSSMNSFFIRIERNPLVSK